MEIDFRLYEGQVGFDAVNIKDLVRHAGQLAQINVFGSGRSRPSIPITLSDAFGQFTVDLPFAQEPGVSFISQASPYVGVAIDALGRIAPSSEANRRELARARMYDAIGEDGGIFNIYAEYTAKGTRVKDMEPALTVARLILPHESLEDDFWSHHKIAGLDLAMESAGVARFIHDPEVGRLDI